MGMAKTRHQTMLPMKPFRLGFILLGLDNFVFHFIDKDYL